METQEINETNKVERVATSIRIETDLHSAITMLADEDDRPSVANMVERLLKTHPRVKKILEAEAAGVGA